MAFPTNSKWGSRCYDVDEYEEYPRPEAPPQDSRVPYNAYPDQEPGRQVYTRPDPRQNLAQAGRGAALFDVQPVLADRLRAQSRLDYSGKAPPIPAATSVAAVLRAAAEKRALAPPTRGTVMPVHAPPPAAPGHARRVRVAAEPRHDEYYDDPPVAGLPSRPSNAGLPSRPSNADRDKLVAQLHSQGAAIDAGYARERDLNEQIIALKTQNQTMLESHRTEVAVRDAALAECTDTVSQLIVEITNLDTDNRTYAKEQPLLLDEIANLEQQLKTARASKSHSGIHTSSDVNAHTAEQLEACRSRLEQAQQVIDMLVEHRRTLVDALSFSDAWNDDVRGYVDEMLATELPCFSPSVPVTTTRNTVVDQAKEKLAQLRGGPAYTGADEAASHSPPPRARRGLDMTAPAADKHGVFVVSSRGGPPPPPPPPPPAASKPPPPPPPPPPAAGAPRTVCPPASVTGPATPSPEKPKLRALPARTAAPSVGVMDDLKNKLEARRSKVAPDAPAPMTKPAFAAAAGSASAAVAAAAEAAAAAAAAGTAWFRKTDEIGAAAREAEERARLARPAGPPSSASSEEWADGTSPPPPPAAGTWDPPSDFVAPTGYEDFPRELWGPVMRGPDGPVDGILVCEKLGIQIIPFDIYAFLNFERLGDSEHLAPGTMPHDIPTEALRKVLQGRDHVIVPPRLWKKLYAFKAAGAAGKEMRRELELELNPFHSEEELRKLFPDAVFWRQFLAENAVDGMKPSNWENLVKSDTYWNSVFKFQPANAKKAEGLPAAPRARRLDMAAGAPEEEGEDEEEYEEAEEE
jgi:hypothetical protein